MRLRPVASALNGICAYFTMFPLAFPYGILRTQAAPGDVVLDPFCGRGTTNYAARLLGLPTFGIDSNPVAAAISEGKLANTSPDEVVTAARTVLDAAPAPQVLPTGDFWERAYHSDVLPQLCRLRDGLLRDCRSDARKALRALLLGALHGPQPKGEPSYFSNQAPRTYAPKPRYATTYWLRHGLRPKPVDVLALIDQRARQYYGAETARARGTILLRDSRQPGSFAYLLRGQRARWVITSPPYYGMNTYLPDQWLRAWFMGGPPRVDYSTAGQVVHAAPRAYARQLRQVWRNVAEVCEPDAMLVIRFGGIHDRKVNPLALITGSLTDSGWRVREIRSAGTATRGKRQALHFAGRRKTPMDEHDLWAERQVR